MIKCIATDMDGTLVRADQSISKENIEAIKRAQQAGIEVVVATGRSYEEAMFPLKSAGIVCPVICMNGSEVRDQNGYIETSIPLDVDTYRNIHHILQEQDMYYELYTNQGTFSNDYEKSLSVISDILMSAGHKATYEEIVEGVKERFERGGIKLVQSYEELLQKDQIQLLKLLIFSLDKEKLQETEQRLQQFSNLAVSSSGHQNLEVTNIKAQKGVALEEFVKQKGISLKETMAMGDSYNDISMFERVGFAVAMGNAPQDIKEMCHYITDHNENHGVAKAIYKVLNENL